MSLNFAQLLTLAAFILSQAGDAAIHHYSGKFSRVADAWLYRGGREGLYASTRDAVAHWSTIAKGIANGKSYLRFDQLKFTRPLEEASVHKASDGETGFVQALLFDVRNRDRVGYMPSARNRHFCCTPELVGRTGCTVGKLIVSPVSGSNQWPRVIDIPFTGNNTVVVAQAAEIPVTTSGMYYLWFVICDKTLTGVSVSGATVWKNPAGYLPGMMSPFLNFYALMSALYLVLGALWFVQFVRFYEDIFALQHCITAVVLLGMLEMAVWYFDFVNFNATGKRPYGITMWAVGVTAVRKTVSRVLILLVAMGYGVVRPTLGGLTDKVLLLGGGYFLATLALDVVQNVGAVNDLSSGERLLLVLPVAVLDAVFILWIFSALSQTVQQLQVKRNTHKLDLYSKFTNTMALAVVVSVVWIGFEMYSKLADQYNEHWENDWVTSAFWHVLTLAILSVICFLWAPSQSATRFAFQVGDDADEEQVALTEPSATTARAEDKKPVNTDVFSLEDEVEEGKRE